MARTKLLSSWINFNSPESPFRNQFSRISSSSGEWIKPSFSSGIFRRLVSRLWSDFKVHPFSFPLHGHYPVQVTILALGNHHARPFRLLQASSLCLWNASSTLLPECFPPESLQRVPVGLRHLGSLSCRMGAQILHYTNRPAHSLIIT